MNCGVLTYKLLHQDFLRTLCTLDCAKYKCICPIHVFFSHRQYPNLSLEWATASIGG